jgi:DNA polymerase elongation subunit (family B)
MLHFASLRGARGGDVNVRRFSSEIDLIDAFVEIVVDDVDPDIIVAWEIQTRSLGYLCRRADYLWAAVPYAHQRRPYALNQMLARTYINSTGDNGERITPKTRAQAHAAALFQSSGGSNNNNRASHAAAMYAQKTSSGLLITGRIVLNAWRLLRGEVKVKSSSFESLCAAVLGERVPHFDDFTLTRWFQQRPPKLKKSSSSSSSLSSSSSSSSSAPGDDVPLSASPYASGSSLLLCLTHYLFRARTTLRILDKLDFIGKTSELARIFGITFFQVLSRGSQFRVESMLTRITRPQRFLCVSAGPRAVQSQPALECRALTLEPISRFYEDPVVGLDFRSLYPSIVIAYNMCYSTCVGKPMLGEAPLKSPPNAANAATAAAAGVAAAAAGANTNRVARRRRGEADDDDDDDDDVDSDDERGYLSQRSNDDGDGDAAGGTSDAAATAAAAAAPTTATTFHGLPLPKLFRPLGCAPFHCPPGTLERLKSRDALWTAENGCMFVTATERKGILPRLLSELLDTRQLIKRKLKTPQLKLRRNALLARALNNRQLALKLVANVTYGYTTASFRFVNATSCDAISCCSLCTQCNAI